MFFTAFVWVLAYASKGTARTTQLVAPWEMKLIEADNNCPKLCGNWSALYLFNDECVDGEMVLDTDGVKIVVAGDASFCPDKNAVVAWTVDEEQVYEAAYMLSEGLMNSERKIFELMTLERKMRLSVHPWQKVETQEIHNLLARRMQARDGKFKCIGERTNERVKHKFGTAPEKVTIQYGTWINHIEMKFPVETMVGGDETDDGAIISKKLPECVAIALVNKDGDYLTGLQFFGHGKETKFLGEDSGDSFVIVAPQGKCLGDMRLRYGDYLNRICFKFNVDE